MQGSNLSFLKQLRASIESRQATVGIIGLGYVGLPLANACIKNGFQVVGFDIDPAKVEKLNLGESYIGQIKSQTVKGWRQEERFRATDNMSELGQVDVTLVCVPTPLTDSRDPDLTYVKTTAEKISDSLRPGQLIILESTTYPGTTRDVLLPILNQSELKMGEEYFLAFSPEREDPGNQNFTTSEIPKVVGGIDPTSSSVAAEFYNAVFKSVVQVDSCEIAEACKILENTYRSVNIAMINELKVLFQRMGIDVWSVIEAAKTKPFGFQAFYPGPGLGGHCIPIDPFYLSWVARKYEMPTKFIELAGEINSNMPNYVISRVSDALNSLGMPLKNSNIGIVGVAYKKDIDDHRESPAYKLIELLVDRGADVSYCDPHIPTLPAARRYDVPKLTSSTASTSYWSTLDCALICTNHSIFDYEEIVKHAKVVVDCRNATSDVSIGREKIWMA